MDTFCDFLLLLKWAPQKWDATIFSSPDPFLLIVHENDQFCHITTKMEYEIFKWAPKTTKLSTNELKWAGSIFSSFWPHFINSAVKQPILMCQLYAFNKIFKWAPKSTQLSSTELKMSQ